MLLQTEVELTLTDGNGQQTSSLLTIQQLGTSKALRYSVHLGKWAAAAASGLEKQGQSFEDWNINFEKLTQAVISQLDDVATPKLLQELVRDSLIAPTFSETWWESTFSGQLDQLMILLTAIFEHNWGSMGDYLGKTMQGVMGDTSSTSQVTE
jgi:hypothetical protein